MSKPKFSKKKCRKCKWHGTGIGYPVHIKKKNGEVVGILVHCNYTAYDGHTSCLRPTPEGGSIDIRGEDYYDCKLFEEGTPAKPSITIVPSGLNENV